MLCAAHYASLFAPAIGSTTTVSEQALAIFPSTDTTNQMLGFAAFVNGFTLNNGGSCIYNSYYPVVGAVTLNTGTLSLSKDLIFQSGLSFNNGGTITGNSRLITFLDTSPIQLPINTVSPSIVTYVTDINTSKAILSCDWSYDNNYLAAVNSGSDTFGVYSFNGSTITAAGTETASTSFTCVRWHPTQYYLATGRTSGSSQDNFQVWQYTPSTKSFSIVSQVVLSKTVEAVCWHPTGKYVAVGTASGTNEIDIYGFSNNTLTSITSVNLATSRNISANALSWDSTGTYLVIGTASSTASGAYELLLYSFNGSTLTLNSYVNANVAVNSVSYSPTGPYVAVGLASGSSCVEIYQHNPTAGTLTLLTNAEVAEALAVESVQWSPNGQYAAIGTTSGTGTQFNVYAFNATAQTLTLVYGFTDSGIVYDVSWSPNGNYIAIGDSVDYLSVYSFYYPATGTLVFNNAKLRFNSDVTFNVPTIFQGTCAIDGNDQMIQCGAQGSIIVASGASLTIKNVILNNIISSTFYCADNTGIITFNNVTLDLSAANYTFSAGSFNVNNVLHIKGLYGFNYQANQISTINSNATLLIDRGSFFNYSPSTSSNNLLVFADSTASLVLHSATLQVSNAGLQLTKGYIEIDGKSYVVNSGTQASQGLLLGDGVSSANDVVMRLLPNATCLVTSGYITDQSV